MRIHELKKPEGSTKAPKRVGRGQGREEKQRVMEWAEALDPKQYHAAYVNMLNQQNHPPEILWVTKKNNGA